MKSVLQEAENVTAKYIKLPQYHATKEEKKSDAIARAGNHKNSYQPRISLCASPNPVVHIVPFIAARWNGFEMWQDIDDISYQYFSQPHTTGLMSDTERVLVMPGWKVIHFFEKYICRN